MTAESPAAGWYPADELMERYWDGQEWTDQTRPRVAQPAPAASAPEPASARPTALVTALVVAAAGVGFVMAMQGASLLTGTGNLWTGVAIAAGAAIIGFVVKVRMWIRIIVLLAALGGLGNTIYVEDELNSLREDLGGHASLSAERGQGA